MLLDLTWHMEGRQHHLLKTRDCLPLTPFLSGLPRAPAFPQLVSHEPLVSLVPGAVQVEREPQRNKQIGHRHAPRYRLVVRVSPQCPISSPVTTSPLTPRANGPWYTEVTCTSARKAIPSSDAHHRVAAHPTLVPSTPRDCR